jgi:hypothetical protein
VSEIGQQPGPLHVTVAVAQLAGWIARLPGLALPPPFDALGATAEQDGDPPPPLVAASLAVHGIADVTAELHLDSANEQVTACQAISGDLLATLVLRSGPLGEVAEVGLAHVAAAVPQLLRWLPDVPAEPRASARLGVAGWDDAVRCWVATLVPGATGWCRQSPDGAVHPCSPAQLGDELCFVLAECQARAELSDG